MYLRGVTIIYMRHTSLPKVLLVLYLRESCVLYTAQMFFLYRVLHLAPLKLSEDDLGF
jgi:hypothetical protein